MSPDPLSCFGDQDIAEAAAMMGDTQVCRLLVMDREDILDVVVKGVRVDLRDLGKGLQIADHDIHVIGRL